MNFQTMKVLFKKELGGYFKGPLGYVFLVIFMFGMGYLTFEPGRGSFFILREASLSAFFRYIPWMFLFLVPAISMRLWADERRSGTVEMLFTMPISVKEAVLAKFFASWSFLVIALAGTFPLIFTVIYLGNPDPGVIFMGYFGSFLLGGAFLAIGGFFSALSKNPIVSFILSVVTGYLLLMAGSPPILDFLGTFLPRYFLDVFASLSFLNHFETMERGVLSLDSLWFFGVLLSSWLYGCMALLEENKAS